MDNVSIRHLLFKPRSAVIALEQSTRRQIGIFAIILLSYFLQFLMTYLFQEQEKLNRWLTFKGFLADILILLVMSIAFLTIVYAASLAFWTAAQCVKGKASLPQTRAAVLWTTVWTIPLGFFFLLIASTLSRDDLFWMRVLLSSAMLTSLCYGWIVLLKTLSQVNGFGMWRALFTAICGCFIFYGFVQVTLAFYRAMHWIS